MDGENVLDYTLKLRNVFFAGYKDCFSSWKDESEREECDHGGFCRRGNSDHGIYYCS